MHHTNIQELIGQKAYMPVYMIHWVVKSGKLISESIDVNLFHNLYFDCNKKVCILSKLYQNTTNICTNGANAGNSEYITKIYCNYLSINHYFWPQVINQNIRAVSHSCDVYIIVVAFPPMVDGGVSCWILEGGAPPLKMPERPRKGANFPLKYPVEPKEGQFSVKCPFEGNPWGS